MSDPLVRAALFKKTLSAEMFRELNDQAYMAPPDSEALLRVNRELLIDKSDPKGIVKRQLYIYLQT